jgi:hypothetical protein
VKQYTKSVSRFGKEITTMVYASNNNKHNKDARKAVIIQSDHKSSVHLMITVQKTCENILNSFNHHDNTVRIRDTRWR